MLPAELKLLIKTFPRTSGVYVFRDAKKTPLYVGKATNLRTRVGSYAKTTHPRLIEMVRQATTVTHETTSNDIEALIVESQKIKSLKPFFNVALRDDKQYAYVLFSNDEYPRITVTHQPAPDADVIGPFTETSALKTTLRLLRGLFPYCTCTQQHHVRCLNAHIGKCLGFCCLKESTPSADERGTYRQHIRAIHDILTGKKQTLIRTFTRRMDTLAKQGKLEDAITLRDQITRLERVFTNVQVLVDRDVDGPSPDATALADIATLCKLPEPPRCIEGYDIANIQGKHATGSMVVFIDGTRDKNSYRKFRIRGDQTPDDTRMLTEVLARRFAHSEWPRPDLVIIDGGKSQLNTAITTLARFDYPAHRIIALTKDDAHRGDHILHRASARLRTIPLTTLTDPARNLILTVDTEAHRFAISYYRRLHRKSLQPDPR